MKEDKLFTRITIFCALLSLVAGIYIFFMSPASEQSVFRVGFGAAFIIMAFFVFIIGEAYTRLTVFLSGILENCEGQQKLLLDLRDGTKTFYAERRRSSRAGMGEGLNVKIAARDVDILSRVLNISSEGALVRTAHEFSVGDEVTLSIYLPLFARPVTAKAKVIRTVPRPDVDPAGFDVGVEFKGMSSEDTERLLETITRTLSSRE